MDNSSLLSQLTSYLTTLDNSFVQALLSDLDRVELGDKPSLRDLHLALQDSQRSEDQPDLQGSSTSEPSVAPEIAGNYLRSSLIRFFDLINKSST